MSFLTNVLLAFVMGFVGFFLLPILAAALTTDLAERVSRYYDDLAMKFVGSGAIVLRETGGITLRRLSYDAELGRHKTKIGGVTKYFSDPADCMARWCGKAFGLADEKRGVIFDPMHADFGKEFTDTKRQNEWVITDGGGKDSSEYRRKFFDLSPGFAYVELGAVRSIVQGSSNPMRIDDHYRIWDIALSSRSVSFLREHLDRISAVGTGFVIMWITAEVGGSATFGGGGTSTGIVSEFMWLLPAVLS